MRSWRIGHTSRVVSGAVLVLLGFATLCGCSSQAGVAGEPGPSATATVDETVTMGTSDGIPHYYAEFDPDMGPSNLLNPCEELSDSDLSELGLVRVWETYTRAPSGRMVMCQYRIADGEGGTLPVHNTFLIGGDLITRDHLSARGLVFYEDGAWLFSNENSLMPTSTCTASVPTSRGRFSVARTELNTDKDYQLTLCEPALEMALKVGEYLFRGSKSN